MSDRKITRTRKVNGKIEESVIDFVVVCDKVNSFVDKFDVDETKIYALSNYTNENKAIHSDYNTLMTEVNFKFIF